MTKQTEIPGTEQVKNDDIERCLDGWLAATDEAKRAADLKKLAHAALLMHVTNAGLQVYSYLCPRSGKRKRIRVDAQPKIKAEADGSRGRKKRNADAELSTAEKAERKLEKERKKAEAEANRVESRRVKRESVEELREEVQDPFAATRRAMEGEVH